MSQSRIENGYSVVDAIDAKISASQRVLRNGNGTNAVFLEVPKSTLIKAGEASAFFQGQLPLDIDEEPEAKLTLISGKSSRVVKLAVFAGLPDNPRVETFRLDLDDEPQITEGRDFKNFRRPYSHEFDASILRIIDGSHPVNLDILQLQNALHNYVTENNWSEEDVRGIQNALMIAELHHRVKGPDGKMRPQKRESGERYISHPWGAMWELIDAGITNPDILKATLVHDVPEDSFTMRQPEIDPQTEIAPKSYSDWNVETWDILTPLIGSTAATYAVLLARPKPDGIKIFSKEQANQFYRMNLTQFPEVLLIKMADRLHNIRTLGSMPPEKQRATIISTIDNYVPIFEFARQSYPEAVDYLMNELMNALRIAGANNNIDVDML